MAENMNLVELTAAEIVETPKEGAMLFCLNPDGSVNRVSAEKVGGGAVKTAVIKDSKYDNVAAGVQTASAAAVEITYACENMTFDEAYAAVLGGTLTVVMKLAMSDTAVMQAIAVGVAAGVSATIPCIGMMNEMGTLYWSADGISTTNPNA